MIIYLNNIIKNPQEEKFKKLNLKGKAFTERVSSCYGAVGSLEAIGFAPNAEDFLVLNKTDLELLKKCVDHLEKTKSTIWFF